MLGRLSAALLLAPLLASIANAQTFSGSFDVTGRVDPGATATSARLTVVATGPQSYRVSREGRTGAKVFTWTDAKATVVSGRLRARFTLGAGILGALTPGAAKNELSATYTITADGKRIEERIRNLTHVAPDEWLTITTTGTRAPASLTNVPDFAAFDRLAQRDDVPGAIGIRDAKILMVDLDKGAGTLHVLDSKRFQYHFEFYTKGLGRSSTLEDFNKVTYFTNNRKNLAGEVLYHESYVWPDGTKGLYALQFWPTDPVQEAYVARAYRALVAAMPFAAKRIAYHPAGETQEGLYLQEKAKFDQDKIPVVLTRDLFAGLDYMPMNLEEGFGLLRVVEAGARPPSVRDVVIFKQLPNDLSHTGGIITEEPQTPLSHINLKAKQNKTPNAFIRNASASARIKPLLGKIVYYKVGADDFTIREATQAEADAFLESQRPKNPTLPPRDLSVTEVRPLDAIGNGDTDTVGAKAANLGELRKFLPADVVPAGFAIPFAFYDSFMKANGFYDEARAMMADPAFKSDPAVREKMLGDFQKKIKKAPVPADVAAKLTALQKSFPPGTPIRMRSSTNNEDLPGFNGAGLYDSFTHRPDEGDISKTVKQVWASLWNYRAFEERDFYRIDHFQAAMGIAVHKNFDDERANGVAITRNIFDPNWPGYYVNAQVGESLITNPDGSTPDEFLVSAIGEHGEFETQYVRHSNQVGAGKTVLTQAQIRSLVDALAKIQAHFKVVYGKQKDPKFAMDVEWKFDSKGALVVKQARPVVE